MSGHDVQRSVKRTRVLRAAAVFAVALNAFLLAVDIAAGSALAFVPVILMIALLLLIVMETRLIRSYALTREHAERLELAARVSAARVSPCSHPAAEPVDLLLTGERVAWVCPDCNAGLPAGWTPPAQVPAQAAPVACECTDETRSIVQVRVPGSATALASYCSECGRGTGTLTATGSVMISGTAALSGSGTLTSNGSLTDGEVKDATEAAQHFAQLARVGRESCISYCPVCADRDHAYAFTLDDMILMRSGAYFGTDATVTLPSGKKMTGAGIRRWIARDQARRWLENERRRGSES